MIFSVKILIKNNSKDQLNISKVVLFIIQILILIYISKANKKIKLNLNYLVI